MDYERIIFFVKSSSFFVEMIPATETQVKIIAVKYFSISKKGHHLKHEIQILYKDLAPTLQ
jgi:hypothetical protein